MARLHALLKGLPEGGAVDVASPRALAQAARSALTIGRADDAVDLGRAALALDPGSARAWSVVGDALWSLERVHDARVAYEEAVALDDKDLATAVACARAQLHDGARDAGVALLSFVLLRSSSDELTQTATALLEDAR
jgi:cytochrome c-type biogenesis protein CcmH/NrfG